MDAKELVRREIDGIATMVATLQRALREGRKEGTLAGGLDDLHQRLLDLRNRPLFTGDVSRAGEPGDSGFVREHRNSG